MNLTSRAIAGGQIGGYGGGDPKDPAFRELIMRWFQYGMTCPLFRQHGSRPTEIWLLGNASSRGRRRHSTPPLAAIDWHSVGIYTVLLLPLLSFSVKMIVWPVARNVSEAAVTKVIKLREQLAWGSVALSLCTTAHPLYTRIANIRCLYV